jgi:hypothetical protein
LKSFHLFATIGVGAYPRVASESDSHDLRNSMSELKTTRRIAPRCLILMLLTGGLCPLASVGSISPLRALPKDRHEEENRCNEQTPRGMDYGE